MDIIQRPTDSLRTYYYKKTNLYAPEFSNFTFMHCRVTVKMTSKLIVSKHRSHKYATVQMTYYDSNVCTHWFESSLDPLTFFSNLFFTASDAMKNCARFVTGFKYRQSHIMVSSYTVSVSKKHQNDQ